METVITILIVLAAVFLLFAYFIKQQQKPPVITTPIPASYRSILEEQVVFYTKLSAIQKTEFEQRVQQFLATVKITGVKTTVEDIDKVLIASSAVIPIFSFKGWEYMNLHEVLLYPDSFNHDFDQKGSDRNILGMVGSGAYNNVMILSQFEVRQAFLNKTGKTNTAIHEFVHLIDKTDGTVDGVPEFILQQKYIMPWLQLMQQEIKNIIADKSDINPYGATNEAEFFAVVSEYFFERPDLLQEKHPGLYDLLSRIFARQPENDNNR